MSIGNLTIDKAFRTHLPSHVNVVPAPWDQYINFAIHTWQIRDQIEAGIYTPRTIEYELLSVAWTWPHVYATAVCFDLIRWHMKDVPRDLAEAWVQTVAIHETHHHLHHFEPCDPSLQMQRERECNEAVEAKYPKLAAAARQAEQASPSIRRVLARYEEPS